MIKDSQLTSISFDQYQRYKVVSEIINAFRKGGNKFKILEVGPGAEENLKKFLPNDNIYFLDKEYPREYAQKGNYICANFIKIDLNETYDFVVSVDTYEHIAPIHRENFLNKLLQSSNIAAILAAPFNTQGVAEYELLANEWFKLIHGDNHRWLIEHIQNGLPELEDTLESIKGLGLDCKVINNGYLPFWFEMMSIIFMTEGKAKFVNCVQDLNAFYNLNIHDYDNQSPSYRQIIVAVKCVFPDLSHIVRSKTVEKMDFKANYETLRTLISKMSVTALEQILSDRDSQITALNERALQAEAQSIDRDSQITALNERALQAEAQSKSLEHEIAEMQRSIVWQLVMKHHNCFVERAFPQGSTQRKWYDQWLEKGRKLANRKSCNKAASDRDHL